MYRRERRVTQLNELNLFLGRLDVDGREKREDECLDDSNQELDRVDDDQDELPDHRHARGSHGGSTLLGNRKDLLGKDTRKDRERAHDDVAGEHIAKESDGQGNQTKEGREELNKPDGRSHGALEAMRERLEISHDAMLLDADVDEVNEGDDGQGGRHRDRTGAGVAAGDDAHDVIDKDEEEERGDEREVRAPRGADDSLDHVVTGVLDHKLDAVDKATLGHEALGLLLDEDAKDDGQQHNGHKEPERVLRDPKDEIAADGRRKETRDKLVDHLGQSVKDAQNNVHVYFPSLCPRMTEALRVHGSVYPHGQKRNRLGCPKDNHALTVNPREHRNDRCHKAQRHPNARKSRHEWR